MSLRSRIVNLFRGDRLSEEIDEELRTHIAEAIERGRDPIEARRAFGSALRRGEESRDIRLIPWLDGLRADAVFGWRQLKKRKVTSAAAILSLGLAIGACTSAFRLIDALLLRPLPVADPAHLYSLAREGVAMGGKPQTFDGWAYPDFELMREIARGQAELIAVSYAQRMDVTYRSDAEMEKATLQYSSAYMFTTFGLRPVEGRLFTPDDDRRANAVISYDYWSRRFGRDPGAIGKTFHLGDRVYQIVGVVQSAFTGTEPGTVTDVFLPATMHPGAVRDDWTWMRTLAQVKPGVALEPLRAKLDATSRAFEANRAKGFKGMPKETIAKFIDQKTVFLPATSGTSDLQGSYRRALGALAVLVAMVLLIACANVANLMAAQAAARAREMALRVSIGAGRWRLVQLVLMESAMLAFFSAAVGAAFAWWSAPSVVRMINPPSNPARLVLPADWRVLGFGLALTTLVTLLFGLVPALKASAIIPVTALKGGADPHSRRRLMKGLIAAQVAFCFVVLFGAGLFAATFDRLSTRPIGFSAEGLLNVETMAQIARPAVFWNQVAERLRAVAGVESVTISGWPLLGGGAWNGFVSVDGAPPGPVLAYYLSVSPGWIGAMKIPLVRGRDFREGDRNPGAAIVNEVFVREFFGAQNPVGKFFARGDSKYEVVGVMRDAPYRNIREAILPVAFLPFDAQPVSSATFLVRTRLADPMALASTMRRQVPQAGTEFRVTNIRTQAELVRAQTLRERLLAMLALFFAGLALLLAGIGLYGVLDYSVLQRRREIGIRMAIGARAGEIARRVTTDVLAMVALGACCGFALALLSARYIEALLYDVRTTEPQFLAAPWMVILLAALVAAMPAAIRAVRTDPVASLRGD